jgi:hypothetical protein
MTNGQAIALGIGATVLVLTIIVVQYIGHLRFMRSLRAEAANLRAHHRPPTQTGEHDSGGVDTVDKGGDA